MKNRKILTGLLMLLLLLNVWVPPVQEDNYGIATCGDDDVLIGELPELPLSNFLRR